MFARVIWWKRAKKSAHGVRGIERLMQDIRKHAKRTQCQNSKCAHEIYTAITQSERIHGSTLHLLKRKLTSQYKRINRQQQYYEQLLREKRRASKRRASGRKLKRLLKRLKKYNASIKTIMETRGRIETHLERVERQIVENKQRVATDLKKLIGKIRTKGVCAYCRRDGQRLSREHLLPRSVGGRAIIRVCFACNFKRGNSGNFQPFLEYIRENPHHWTEALACTSDISKTTSWLQSWDLSNM